MHLSEQTPHCKSKVWNRHISLAGINWYFWSPVLITVLKLGLLTRHETFKQGVLGPQNTNFLFTPAWENTVSIFFKSNPGPSSDFYLRFPQNLRCWRLGPHLMVLSGDGKHFRSQGLVGGSQLYGCVLKEYSKTLASSSSMSPASWLL